MNHTDNFTFIAFLVHFENVNYVLLGIDYDNHCIGIKPVGKQAINDGIYPQDQLHKISRGKDRKSVV